MFARSVSRALYLYFTEEGEVRVRFLEDGIQRVVKAEGELIGRVLDPDPDPAFFLIADPDPAFFLIVLDPDPAFLIADPGSSSESRVFLMTKNCEKNYIYIFISARGPKDFLTIFSF
jgi:hypothetical protein